MPMAVVASGVVTPKDKTKSNPLEFLVLPSVIKRRKFTPQRATSIKAWK